jgi:hypothetical protein
MASEMVFLYYVGSNLECIIITTSFTLSVHIINISLFNLWEIWWLLPLSIKLYNLAITNLHNFKVLGK